LRRTIDSTDNPAVLGAATHRNNGRYNGNGREWATPPEVFGPLHAEFGFTLDACATSGNAKLPRFYTEAQDGLTQSWAGERVFMNPPYGREIYVWTRKARDAGTLVVGLLPASCDLKWWHEDVVGKAEVRYIRGRVRFLTGGPYRASGFFASVIVIWRNALVMQCAYDCGLSECDHPKIETKSYPYAKLDDSQTNPEGKV
jgi:phage N-6-adenine-methyltransferase